MGVAPINVAGLTVGLNAPGMTELLRCGVGGLAATLYALAQETPSAQWPAKVPVGKGFATISATEVRFEFAGGAAADTLGPLFSYAFQIRNGVIFLPGCYEARRHPPDIVLARLHQAIAQTFLQHAKSRPSSGSAVARTATVDDQQVAYGVLPIGSFAHQALAVELANPAVVAGEKHVTLKGSTYPGAFFRHPAFQTDTELTVPAPLALAAAFGLVGTLTYCAQPRIGIVVVPEPTDLLAFARVRGRLTPRLLASVEVAGPGDAILSFDLQRRTNAELAGRDGIGAVHAVTLRKRTKKDKQFARARTLRVGAIAADVVATYATLLHSVPARTRVRDDGSAYSLVSCLRGFVGENLAAGQPWYRDFATARTQTDKPLLIHKHWKKNGNGALTRDDCQGVIAMTQHLEAAEKLLVQSVHTALRQRLGAIADEMSGNPAGMKNRFQRERDHWRLAFAGAKTPDQIRAALADLWSRAGSVRQLQDSWPDVLPLLRPQNWATARDLALVALASYQGRGAVEAVAAAEAADSIDEP